MKRIFVGILKLKHLQLLPKLVVAYEKYIKCPTLIETLFFKLYPQKNANSHKNPQSTIAR